jgi:hypothetical protein
MSLKLNNVLLYIYIYQDIAVGWLFQFVHYTYNYRCEFEPGSGETLSIQLYVIKFVSDLRLVMVIPESSRAHSNEYLFNFILSKVK